MTQTELRNESRRSIAHEPKRDFSIMIDDREIEVLAVHDVSASGIRVQVGSSLGISTAVRVRYRRDVLDLQFNGITCWETPAADGGPDSRVVGIELMAPTTLFSII